MFERYNEGLGIMEQYWPYGEISSGLANPYWVQNRQIRENKKTRYMVNASLKYQIFDWLDVTGRVKIDNYEIVRHTRRMLLPVVCLQETEEHIMILGLSQRLPMQMPLLQ